MPEKPLTPRYNEAARYAFKQIHPEGFLRFLVPDAFQKWQFTGWVDSQVVSFPGDPERRCDTVARFERLQRDLPPVALVADAGVRQTQCQARRLALCFSGVEHGY